MPGSGLLEVTLGATPDEVMRGCDSLRAFCAAHGVPEEAAHDVMLVFEEVGSNIVEHGYRSLPEGRLFLRAVSSADAVRLEVRDEAGPFNPLEAPGADVAARWRQGRLGGLGLPIVKALADSVEYSRGDGQNRLVLTVRLGASRTSPEGTGGTMPLDIVIDRMKQGGVPGLRVSLVGSLDTATSPVLKARLEALLEEPIQVVAFDLQGLAFLSSAGLQVFLAVQKRLRSREGKVLMLNMQPQISKVFDIVKAMVGFSIFASAREMDEYLAKIQADHRQE